MRIVLTNAFLLCSKSNGRKLVSKNLAVLGVGRPRARDYYDLAKVAIELMEKIVERDCSLMICHVSLNLSNCGTQ